MILSFIITTYNSSKHIDNCLKSIILQKHPEIEIIIVDNNSSDQTVEICKKYTNKIFNKGPERSAQRNFGVKQALSDNIIYLDSDMILSPFFIESVLNIIQSEKPLALYIYEEIIISNLFSKIRNHERYFYTATPIDCVRYINKKFFNTIGKFDENLTGPEDWDLNNRVLKNYSPKLLSTNILKSDLDLLSKNDKLFYKEFGIDLYSINIPCVFHDERDINFLTYIKKKSFYSKSFEKYINKWGKNNYFIKKQLGFLYRFIFVFIEKGKYRIFLKRLPLSILIYLSKFIIYFIFLLRRI